MKTSAIETLLTRFKASEAGASLVEYAVALIVVTIVGGGGVIAVGGNASVLSESAEGVTTQAVELTGAGEEEG